MKTEILGVIAQIVLMVALSYPLGKYIAKVYKKEKTWLDLGTIYLTQSLFYANFPT